MDLHYFGIFDQCVQEDPVSQLNGQATGHCKLPNQANPEYVPIYKPKNQCPDPVNYNPRRNEQYCKPNPSRSLPLSSDEYLRKLLRNGGRPLSNSYILQSDPSTGVYRTTEWTAAGTSKLPSTAEGTNIGPIISAPPVTGTGGTALDAGTLTQERMLFAARGSISALDSSRDSSKTTFRRMGLAIASGGACGFEEPCIPCDFAGTSASVVVGQFKCTCDSAEYNSTYGRFSPLWGQTSLGGSYTTPALSPDGRLIYVGAENYVHAIETSSGNFIWKFENPFVYDNFYYSNITIGPDETLFIGGTDSPYFFAVNGLTGAIKWHFTTGNPDNYFASKPVFNSAKNIIYVTSAGPAATVYSFDLMGNLLNTYTNPDLTNNFTLQSPAVGSNDRVYITYNTHLVCLDSNLNYKWSITCGQITGTYNLSWFSPSVGKSGLIYVGSANSKLYCFVDNGSTATQLWVRTFPATGIVLSPVFGLNDQIYVTFNRHTTVSPPTISDNAGSLYCVSAADGSDLYVYDFIGPSIGDIVNWIFPTVGPNGKIYISKILDSGLLVLEDTGSEFTVNNDLENPIADSPVYGSLCLSAPVVNFNGAYWCNGNQTLPSIFGYPEVLPSNKSAIAAPVLRPRLRIESDSVTVVNKTVPIVPHIPLHK